MADEDEKRTKAENESSAYVFDLDKAMRKLDSKTSEELKALALKYFGTEDMDRGFFGHPDVAYEAEGSSVSDSDVYVFNIDESRRKYNNKTPEEKKALALKYFGTEDMKRGFRGHPDVDYEAGSSSESDSDEDGREGSSSRQQQQQQPSKSDASKSDSNSNSPANDEEKMH